MPTARIASVTIGINDYANEHYRQSGFALRYAVADAEAFHAYLTASWPARAGATHILLRDREATRPGIDNAFASLAGPEPYDLLIVYMAGHGEVGKDGAGWFCTADAHPGKRGLGPAELDQLFAGIQADVTILLLDCCYAESIVTASDYFRELGDARGKLFLCSARRDQLTFEDDDWGHGALSFLLLNALATDSPLPKTNGAIAVEGTLFPHLCEQLPLLVFREKAGAKQEPVMGAISAGTIRLPSGSTGIRQRDATIFEVVRARYRQALAVTAAVALIALALNQLLLYHFSVSVDDGYIQVRRGLAPLFWSTIPGYRLHAEIAIDKSDTTPLELGDAMLRSGAVWGVWTQKNADHLRRWPDELSQFLSPELATRLAVLIGKDLPERALNRVLSNDAQWRPDILAEAFLLNSAKATQLQARHFSRLPDLSKYDCATPVDNRFDFTLLEISSADILFILDALQMAIEQKSNVTPLLLENASKLVSYRTRHLTRKLVGEEYDSAVAEYRALLRLLDLAVVNKIMPTYDVDPVAGWCEPVILAQQALATPDDSLPVVVERLLATADPTKSGAGDLLNFPQLAALDALEIVAARRRLPESALNSVFGFLKADGRGLEGHPALVDWLKRIATLQVLPGDLRAELQAEIGKEQAEFSLIGVRSFDLLARNAPYLSVHDRTAIEAVVSSMIIDHRGTRELATALGYLGCAGLARQRAIEYLGSRVDEARLVRPNTRKVRGFVVQAGDDFAEGIALARIAQTGSPDDALLERIRRFAKNRLGVVEPTAIVRALAARDYNNRTGDQAVREIARNLADSRTSIRHQQLEIAIGAETLLLLPASERPGAVEAARVAWLNEREPDVRMSWASMILLVRKRLSTYDPRPCL